MATWIDAIASRSGPLHTAATQFARSHGIEADPPRGVSGLQKLSGLIACARQANDEVNERDFVAGAGAYFGLILLDHFPSGSHASDAGEHRLRLGTHGFFDPFAAVEAALGAQDTPRALIDALKRAEAEANGESPTARAVNALLRTLRAQPEVQVLGQFDQRVWLEVDGRKVELDLSRVIAATSGESDALLEHAVQRLCASLHSQPAPALAWQTVRAALFPRLVGASFVGSLPDVHDLHLKPLGPDVWSTLVVRYRERARYVRRSELEAWSSAGGAPAQTALQNLAASSERARFLQHPTPHGPLVIAETRDGLDAARLLLPGLHDVLARSLGSPFIAATPHRDTLLACPAASSGVAEELAQRVDAAVRAAPHAIARTLWLVRGAGQLEPFDRSRSE